MKRINSNGFSLIEVMIGLGIMSVIMFGMMSITLLTLKQQTQSNVTFQADTTRRNLMRAINSPDGWKNTISDPLNSQVCSGPSVNCNPLSCLTNTATCVSGAGGSIFSVRDSQPYTVGSNQPAIYDWSGSNGLTSQGTPCTGFSPTPGSGNDQCPLRYEITWIAECNQPLGTPCGSAFVQPKITVKAAYNALTPSRAIAFNSGNYSAVFYQGADTTNCTWQSNALGLVETCGNVGIGTQTPIKNVEIASTSSDVELALQAGTGGGAQPKTSLRFYGEWQPGQPNGIGGNGDGEGFSITYDNGGNTFLDSYVDSSEFLGSGIFFRTNVGNGAQGTNPNPTLNAMSILSNGNVGIGKAAPVTTLDVTNANPAVFSVGKFTGSNPLGATVVYADPNTTVTPGVGAVANDLTLWTNSVKRMSITQNGNVGIGTSTPALNLHVMGIIGASSPAPPGTANNVTELFVEAPDVGVLNYGHLGGAWSGRLDLRTENLPRLTILEQNGNVGIATINPQYTLHVAGSAGLSSGTAWINASDARLKDIHGDYEYGLDEVLKLKPVRFNYKKDNPLGLPSDHPMTGFIAQDVQKVIPDAITENKNGYLELNADPIHWAAVNAIKELYKKMKEAFVEVGDRLAGHDRELQRLEQQNQQLQKDNAAMKSYLCARDPSAPFCR